MLGHKSATHLSDCCDGSKYKSHPLFYVIPQALQICLYYDELEVCNPLGSKRTKHKIGIDSKSLFLLSIIISGTFYFFLGNI